METILEIDEGYQSSDFRFPEMKDFKENGIFSHIKLPIRHNEKIPDEIIDYVYGSDYKAQPRHFYKIREILNSFVPYEVEKGFCSCNYIFPVIEDFKENGIFSHIKLPIPDDQDVPEEIIKYVCGDDYKNRPTFTADVTRDILRDIVFD